MGSETDPSIKITRRKFLIGSGVLVTGATLAAATGNLPRINLGEQPLEEYDKFQEAVQKNPTSRFYYHNAAENPYRLERALNSPALNIEADVINFNNELYIAHSYREFVQDLKVHPEYIDEQKADHVFKKIIESGKNPAIDIKLNSRDEKGFSLLINSIADNIPEDRVITVSGEQELAREFKFRPNSIVVPTFGPGQIIDYQKFAEKEWEDIDPSIIRFGITLNHRFINYDLLAFNRDRNLETNVWTVNDEDRIITLLNMGVTGITSDNEEILARAYYSPA